jgi:palmitoyltransferase
MDHHCYWIDNCVGFYNQGHFVRLILSGGVLCVTTTLYLTLFVYHSIFSIESMGMLTILILSIALTILLPISTILTFLGYNQLQMLFRNRTTIENAEWNDDRDLGIETENPYDLGWLENTKQILGNNVYLWPFPQSMTGNGIVFRTRNPYGL